MARKFQKEVIILSDSDDDGQAISPLTSIKLKASKTSSAKRKVKRLSNNTSKTQPKIDSFFHCVTVRSEKILKPSDCNKISHDGFTTVAKSAPNLRTTSKLSPLKSSRTTKRSAMKGASPQTKMAHKEKSNIAELKGDALWKAVVAQRKKPKSLNEELDCLPVTDPEITTSLDEFESMVIKEQVVHSFPNDKRSIMPGKKKSSTEVDVEEYISSYKQMIPEVIPDEPIAKSAPIFRPKSNIKIKKKKTFDAEDSNTRHLTSTPSKSGFINHSIDLFSDTSLLADDDMSSSQSSALCDDYGRHIVIDCSAGDLNTVMLMKDMNGIERTCELQGFWADTPVKVGDVVNILGEFDSNGYICIDMKQNNMIVINPDYLVSGSVIAGSTTCVRRSVLGSRYRGYEASNRYMLFGSILHEIFQKVLVSEIRDPTEMKNLALNIAHTSTYAHDMYSIDMEEKTLIEGINEYIPPMQSLLEKHMGPKAKDRINIASVRDIEETVWSPRYGMKGKIDVTIDCIVNKGRRKTVPLELKTGRPSSSAEHKGQVTMYSMMLAEKNAQVCTDRLDPGLLVYIKDGSMQEVTHSAAAIKGLVNLRNELCHGLLQGVSQASPDDEFTLDPLPEPINQSRMCGNCAHLITCSLHQRVFKDFTAPPDHIMESLVPESLSHLTQAHLEYFSKWSKLLLIESSTEAKWKTIRELWTKPSPERISSGTCIGKLTVSENSNPTSDSYRVVLSRADSKTTKLAAGDMVVVSEADSKVVIVTTAHLLDISECSVTLHLDRKLLEKQTYCIDKYDFYTGSGTGFTNLARLMENTPESAHLRDIIIDRKSAEFDPFLDDEVEEKLEAITHSLNASQSRAVDQGLLARDYLVIKGYPGTGKTSTIVAMVESMRAQGLSVLITSYTHSAVDNILLKLKQKNVEFIRLGRASKVHPDIVSHSSEHLTKDITTVDQVAAFYAQFHVVGATCLGISHPMLCKRRFDVCIVDEASQILQPVCLGPLFYASKFILVGDNQQLPPLIRSSRAKSLGMEQTLLDLLGDRPGETLVELTLQYRMNEEIMRLSNLLIYNNKLECGTEYVRTDTLKHDLDDMDSSPGETQESWTEAVSSPSLRHSLLLLNTSGCARSPSKKSSIHSNTEAVIVCQVCRLLSQVGVPADSIGVITPYQAQVQLLKGMIDSTDLEVNTVDQYQGRDKSVVVISFARTSSNTNDKNRKDTGILSDLRRLNVAITRAKHKLILVGNVDALTSYTPVYNLISLLKPYQVVDMPLGWSPDNVNWP